MRHDQGPYRHDERDDDACAGYCVGCFHPRHRGRCPTCGRFCLAHRSVTTAAIVVAGTAIAPATFTLMWLAGIVPVAPIHAVISAVASAIALTVIALLVLVDAAARAVRRRWRIRVATRRANRAPRPTAPPRRVQLAAEQPTPEPSALEPDRSAAAHATAIEPGR